MTHSSQGGVSAKKPRFEHVDLNEAISEVLRFTSGEFAQRGIALEVSFDPLPGAQRYNLYFGRLSTVHSGSYDHGTAAPAAPLCAAPTQNAGGGRLRIVVTSSQVPSVDGYFLVTAHVDDVESPAGTRSSGAEIDRSQSVCR